MAARARRVTQTTTYDFASVLTAVEDAGFFSKASCTILGRPGEPGDPTVNVTGSVDYSTYTAVALLSNIPCMIGVSRSGPQWNETKRGEETTSTGADFTIYLDGYFPTIEERYVADVTVQTRTTRYEIMNVQHASQLTFTRMGVRRFRL